MASAAAAAPSGAGGVGAAGGGGPQLVVGGGEDVWVAGINEWGRKVDASLGMMSGAFSSMREEVLGTQVVLGSTIQEAKAALDMMHEGFRQALGISAAEQRNSVEALITHARVKFTELEVKLDVLSVSAAQVTTGMEQWALGEGARTAAAVQSQLGTPPASPRQGPDPFARQDPWQSRPGYGPQRGGAAFLPHPLATPPGMQQPAQLPAAWAAPPGAQQPAPWTPGAREPREFRIDSRGWHAKVLDSGVSPDIFQVWRERALAHLSQGRQDIRRLLVWAETKSVLDLDTGTADKVRDLGLDLADFPKIDFTLHSAITLTLADSLLGRARGCEERGLLLWRNLCAEWAGSAPQYRLAKAKSFQDPARSKDFAALWSALPAWMRLGEEVSSAGFALEDWPRWRS
jgi:hypothetical protein